MSETRHFALAFAAVLCLHGASLAQPASDAFAAPRARMVAEVRAELRAAHIRDDNGLRAILQVLARLPREAFVPSDQRAFAYAPRPVPIGQGQTMSDAFIMAYMTHALDLRPGERVLEIGTGSGYQAAILSALGVHVYTIEFVPELVSLATMPIASLCPLIWAAR